MTMQTESVQAVLVALVRYENDTSKNKNIIALYLAGKALGVDLVKVVEG